MSLLSSVPLSLVFAIFVVATVVIFLTGPRLSSLADQLADRTGLGEAVIGAVLLGASTSTPGTVTSVVAAASGNVDLAAANALGGIAAQTAFLAVADIFHRRANLEHAAASTSNLTQSTMLVVLLAIPLAATHVPAVTVYGVHPASVLLLVVYGLGVRVSMRDSDTPRWEPTETAETRHDEPEEAYVRASLSGMLARFLGLMLVIGVAGFFVARSGINIAERTGLGETVVGALMTAVSTSLPELVTTVAAVRQGALQLAVGGIIGGNMFDVLFLSAADVAYRDGSIYHAITPETAFWSVVGLMMTAVVLLGLIRREPHGIANIGFESATVLAIYAGAALLAVA